MILKVNEYLGKMPRTKEDHANIYAFYFDDEEEVCIETIGIDYPIAEVMSRLIRKRIELSGLDSFSAMNVSPPASFYHAIFSRSSKRLMGTDDNDKSDHSYLIYTIKEWLAKEPWANEVSSSDEIDSDTKIFHWPHGSFFAAPIWAFQGLNRLFDVGMLGDHAEDWVIAYDSRSSEIIDEIDGQVGPSHGGNSKFRESVSKNRVFMSDYDVTINGQVYSAPVILLDKKNKTEFDIEKSLYFFLADLFNLSETESMDSQLKQQQYFGYDIQDLFYFNFADNNSLNTFESSFDGGTTPEKRDAFMKKIIDLGVDPNDSESVRFAKVLSIYLRTFPAKDERFHYKIFYSVVSIPSGTEKSPESPVNKNEGLFDAFFAVSEGPIDSGDRTYYLVSSKFCFPQQVFNLFITGGVVLHEVFEYNDKNGMLSKYCFVDNAPTQSADGLGYKTEVVTPFVKTIQEMLGDKIKDNRFDERLSVKRLSEFPYAFSRIKAAFDREGVPFNDINIVFVYDPESMNILGGYDCKRFRNEDNMSLVDGYAKFPLPLIVFNLANPKIQRREDLSGTIIHEGRHYLDDMKIESGKEAPDFFYKPSNIETDYLKRYEEYLSSKSETAAFAEDALNVLRHYRLEYIYANWVFLKTRIIREYFDQQENLNNYSLPQNLMEAYSRILDRALEIYEREVDEESGVVKSDDN